MTKKQSNIDIFIAIRFVTYKVNEKAFSAFVNCF